MKLVWTEQAIVRLEEIHDFIADHAPETAVRFLKRIFHQVESLAQFPTRGRRVPEFPLADLRELIVGKYRIIYRVRIDCIEIITLFEGHFQQGLKDLTENVSD